MENSIEVIPVDFADRIEITGYDNNGKILSRNYGPSRQEQEEMHINGKCTAWCEYCFDEAIKWYDKNIRNSSME